MDLCFGTVAVLSESDGSDRSDAQEPALLILAILALLFFDAMTEGTEGIDSDPLSNSIFLALEVEIRTGNGPAPPGIPFGLNRWEEQGMASVLNCLSTSLPEMKLSDLTTWASI